MGETLATVPRNFWLLLTPGQYAVNLPKCASRFGSSRSKGSCCARTSSFLPARPPMIAAWPRSLKWVTYFMLNILHFISLIRECRAESEGEPKRKGKGKGTWPLWRPEKWKLSTLVCCKQRKLKICSTATDCCV